MAQGHATRPEARQDLPVWRTHGRYRKQKRGYPKPLYGHRDESIFSVKRLFGEYLASVGMYVH